MTSAVEQLTAWLETLDLGQYSAVLAENDVDLDVLPQLTDTDLKELGFSLGHRRKLLAALQREAASVASAAQAAEAPAQRPGVEEKAERRQLTVMFCDLVGSTALSEALDPEQLRDVMRRYRDTVAGEVAGFEGSVAKLLGDGVLAYFGWPHAHEDDAERAVRAALSAVRAVGAIEVAGAKLAARVGIATGPVVIGDMQGEATWEQNAVVGATPNLAARLQALGEPGEVIVNALTKRLVGGAFDLETLGERQLKGFAEAVAVWRVLAAARTGSRFEASHSGGLTAFVGRDQELGLLMDRWRRAREGEGQLVLLSGEAGIGKSRILREFANELEKEDCRILRYQCSPHEINAAFHAIAGELEASAELQPQDPPEQRLDKLERHLADFFASDSDSFPLFAALLSLPLDRYPPIDPNPQRRKQRTIALLTQRIALLARERPLAMLVEDLHWSDPSGLEALDAMVGRAQRLPLLLAMTARPEFDHGWTGDDHVTAYSLNRLGRADGRSIAERVAGTKKLPPELLDRIVQQTDGVPLFVEELTKAVLEAGFLEEREDRYLLRGALPELAIPTTLHDSLMARLDRVASAKRVIQAASCIGREFSAELLAEALPEERERLPHALEQLLAAQLIFQRGGSGDRRYVFKHALVQDAAYGSLLHSVRRRLHERFAQALESSEDPDPLVLARHYAAAGDDRRASTLYLTLGRRSLEASALPEAIGALELGLQCLANVEPSAGRDRLELNLRVALGSACMANNGWPHRSVADALEPAVPLAIDLDDVEAIGSILWGLWVHYQTRTDFRRAHQWLSQLASVAKKSPASDLPVVYDMSAGCQLFWEADYGRALAFTDHLKTIYEPDLHSRIAAMTNHDPLVFSQHWAGSLAEWIRGYPARALERLEEALALARKIGHPFNLVFALTAGSTALHYLDETDRLLAQCDEAERVVRDEVLGPFSEHVNVMQWRGGAYVQRGDYEQGYALAKKGNDYWTASDGRICTAMFRSWIVRGLAGLGRLDEAKRLNAKNIAHCRDTGDRFMEPECVRLQAMLSLADEPSDRGLAEQFFEQAIALAREQDAMSWALRAATSLAELRHGEGRDSEAAACLEPLLERFTEGWKSTDLRRAKSVLEALV